jgi:hypothetical protein
LIGVQTYLLVAYVSATLVPYAWSPRPHPPTWTWIVPGWLFGVPGYFVTVLAWPVFPLAAAVGILLLAARRKDMADGRRSWLTATTLLVVAVAIFSLTPYGQHLRDWTID